MKDAILLRTPAGNSVAIEIEDVVAVGESDGPGLCFIEYSSADIFVVECDFMDLVDSVFKGYYDLRPKTTVKKKPGKGPRPYLIPNPSITSAHHDQ